MRCAAHSFLDFEVRRVEEVGDALEHELRDALDAVRVLLLLEPGEQLRVQLERRVQERVLHVRRQLVLLAREQRAQRAFRVLQLPARTRGRAAHSIGAVFARVGNSSR